MPLIRRSASAPSSDEPFSPAAIRSASERRSALVDFVVTGVELLRIFAADAWEVVGITELSRRAIRCRAEVFAIACKLRGAAESSNAATTQVAGWSFMRCSEWAV